MPESTPATTETHTGYLDLIWSARRKPHVPGRWQAIAHHPARPDGVPLVEVDVTRCPRFVTAEDIAARIAQLLGDDDNDVAALHLAARDVELGRDPGRPHVPDPDGWVVMTVRHVIRPLATWPEPNTQDRQSGSKFRSTWADTITLLHREAGFIGADLVVIEVVTRTGRVRVDGSIPADATVDHPGAIVSMESTRGALRFATDTYESLWTGDKLVSWQMNVRAIALTMEMLRAVDRHGATASGQQYTGFTAIESGAITTPHVMSTTEAAGVLSVAAGWAPNTIGPDNPAADILRLAFRKATKAGHPQFGGDADQWARVEEAYRVLGGSPDA